MFLNGERRFGRVELITIVGLLAALFSTVSFLPQVIKAFKSRQTKDISLSMYAVLTTGIFLWLVYGLAMGDVPIIIANAVTLVLVSFVLILKVRYG